MSAFICDPSHIGVLAAYAAIHDATLLQWKGGNRLETAQTVARGLMEENIRSVCFRYPSDKDGDRPGRSLKDAEFVELSQHYAAHYLAKPVPRTSTMIIKMADCLDYQSCETNDWEHSLAYRQLNNIRNHALCHLPGYDRAPWEYRGLVDEIEALVDEPS